MVLAEYEFKWENYETAYNLMINNYTDDQETYNFAIDMLAASQLIYAEKIFSELILSDNKKIKESSIYQLANIIELRAKDNVQKLPMSDNIIKATFFDSEPFHESKLNIESNTFLHAIVIYDSLANHYNSSEAKYKLLELDSMISFLHSNSLFLKYFLCFSHIYFSFSFGIYFFMTN